MHLHLHLHLARYSLSSSPHLWEVVLTDLSTWGSGLCHTYNPPAEVTAPTASQVQTKIIKNL